MLNLIRSFLRWIFRDPIVIHLYYALQSDQRVYVRGRILQDKIVLSKSEDGAFKSFINMIKRLMTDEKKNCPITIECASQSYQTMTCDEGYYEIDFELNKKLIDPIIEIKTEQAMPVTSSITVISEQAQYGVISDIDDTIMKTGVASILKWRLMINTFFINPWRRKSFDNFQEVFHHFRKGKESSDNHPIFYISNSPWNLFGYLKTYLRSKNFPDGFLLLRDINIGMFSSKSLEEKNKFKEILKVFSICKELPFVLIGDSGEVDSHIYLKLMTMFPDRIKAVYIREINGSKRLAEIKSMIGKMDGRGLLFTENKKVLAHAKTLGLIS